MRVVLVIRLRQHDVSGGRWLIHIRQPRFHEANALVVLLGLEVQLRHGVLGLLLQPIRGIWLAQHIAVGLDGGVVLFLVGVDEGVEIPQLRLGIAVKPVAALEFVQHGDGLVVLVGLRQLLGARQLIEGPRIDPALLGQCTGTKQQGAGARQTNHPRGRHQGRSLFLQSEDDAGAHTRHLDGLTVLDARLVLVAAGGVDGRAIEHGVR